MILKFTLWAAGLIIVTLLVITGYGVVTGALEWKEYLPFWTGLGGLIIGRISNQVGTKP